MSIYQKRISQLLVYQSIPTAREVVKRAIRNLEELESHEQKLEMDASYVLNKLMESQESKQLTSAQIESQESKQLTSVEIIEIITREFLINEGFFHLSKNVFSRNGYEGCYIFELSCVGEDSVLLKRLKQGNRASKTGSYAFDELPRLVKDEIKKDTRIIKNSLRGLSIDLKRTWEHLNLVKTPASTVTSEEDVIDYLSSVSA